MHPAARVVIIAIVIVLVCSHLVLNIMTEKPKMTFSRRTTGEAPNFGGMEGVNDPVDERETDKTERAMKTAAEGDGQENSEMVGEGEVAKVRKTVSAEDVGKEGVGSVDVVEREDKGSDGGEKGDQSGDSTGDA